jgi:hypothetical protein
MRRSGIDEKEIKMKRFFVAALMLFISHIATAETVAIPGGAGNKFLVIVQGGPGDSDARRLYEAMNVDAVEGASLFEKTISFSVGGQTDVFKLSCRISKTSEAQSCTLQVFPSPWTKIDRGAFLLSMSGTSEAGKIRDQFAAPMTGNDIYRSTNNALVIQTRKVAPNHVDFSIGFRD